MMRVSGRMLNLIIRDLVIAAGVALLIMAMLPGCGGKYEMPTETFKDAFLGEYHYDDGYDWFQGATHMAMLYGHIYVTFSEEGAVRRYYGDGLPEKDIEFTGLERPFIVGVGAGGVAVGDSSNGITVKVYGLDGGAPILEFSDPEWKAIGGLATDVTGNIYVSDMVRNFVRSYNSRGNQRFGTDLADSGFGIGHVLSPRGLWVVDDTLFIAESDGEKNQVQKISTTEPQKGIMFSDDVPLLSSFTDINGDEWALSGPTAVTTDISGNVYVLDGHLGKLFRFTPKGVSDEMVNSSESGGPQALVTPVGIGEYKKRVYTLERIKGTVHRWDSRS
jgi:hypothetical protein